MAIRDADDLKAVFGDGGRPTGTDFGDLSAAKFANAIIWTLTVESFLDDSCAVFFLRF